MSSTATRRALSPSPPPARPGAPVGEIPAYSERQGARWSWSGRARQICYGVIDVVLVCLGGAVAFWLRFGLENPVSLEAMSLRDPSLLLTARAYPAFLLLYCGLIVLACVGQGLYRTPREISSMEESFRVLKAVGLATSLLILFIFTAGNKEISRLVLALAGAINVITLAGWRLAKRRYIIRRARRGIGISRVLIIGAGREGHALAAWMESNRHMGYAMCGFLDKHPNGDKRVKGSIHDLRRVALAEFADEVFITPPADEQTVKEVFLEARKLHLDLHVLPDLYDGLGWRAPIHYFGGFPALRLHSEPIPAVGLAVKRLMDAVLSAIGLVLAAPLLLVACVWIRLDSPGKAIYAATRVGKKGRKFKCYKLRTMVSGADGRKDELREANERSGPFFKMENDPRVTRCGRWLRKYSVDELPQLVNVLRGEMSLVGPRPHPLDDYERYTIEDLRRLDVKPGLTGLWQVSARKDPSFETSMAFDLEYIENWSLWSDLKIIFWTFGAALRGEGQ